MMFYRINRRCMRWCWGVLFFFISFWNVSQAAYSTQTVKGRITEAGSLSPIPFTHVFVLTEAKALSIRKDSIDFTHLKKAIFSGEKKEGVWTAVSDIDGYYKIPDVSVGNIIVLVSSVGFEDRATSVLPLVPAKEMVLDFEMESALQELEAVTVKGRRGVDASINAMATNSVRVFSLEEANRYAGSFGDIARMAQNYAGISSGNDGVNDVVIRGNSPTGLVWRIDGVDVFNPNHFSDGGATGGVVNMINANVLRNSDFFTGAFPASYTNALSGVFDLNLRNGNTEKHEFTGQISYGGFEFGAEGPISRKNKSSYLINARYSVLSLVDKLIGSPGKGTGVPDYADITAKINIPTEKAGTFSFFVLGGMNRIYFLEGKGGNYYSGGGDLYNAGALGILTLSHTYSFSKSTYYKLSVSYQYAESGSFIESSDSSTEQRMRVWENKFRKQRLSASTFVRSNLRKDLNMKTGISYRQDFFDLFVYQVNESGNKEYSIQESGNSGLGAVYTEFMYRPFKNLKILPGISYSLGFMNMRGSLDPRLGFVYEYKSKHEFSLAYGHVSQMQAQWLYATYNGENTDLKMSKAHHLVVGWQWLFAPSFRFKTEVYYQYLYNLPVGIDPSTFCIVNEGTFSSQSFMQYDISMNNAGLGRNMGMEITLEKSLAKGWYALLTASIFDSRYKPSDGHWYNTAFDLNYVVNALGGKEFKIGKNQAVFFDSRIVWTGGQRYTPLLKDEQGTILLDPEGNPTYDQSQTFAMRTKDYFRWDFKIGYRMNLKKTSHEFAFECQNITNRANEYTRSYNSLTGKEETFYQSGFMPMGFYRIYF